MGIFRQFPYSNFHDMNTDWIIKQIIILMDTWKDYNTTWEEWKNSIQEIINNLDEEIANVLNEMLDSGELMTIIAPYLPFVTPQMFGAKGNGVNDDTNAINECLHSNNIIFIPKGYYRITSSLTTNSETMATINCDEKAIFIADGITDYMLICSDNTTGYAHIGVEWNGGIFDMQGISNITGIIVNNYCSFGLFNNITIVNVGDDATGLHIEIESGKNKFDNIKIFGASFTYDINDIDSDFSVNSYDLTRDNTGITVTNSYDFAIGTLYIMGCNLGIVTNGSAQVDVGQYHYWLGTGDGNLISTAQFIKSRAFKALSNGDYWHFNMFYPDQPYIAAECNYISCDNTHYIIIRPESLTDNVSPYAFLGKMLTDYGSMIFENCDIVHVNRAEFRGVDCSQLALRRGAVYIANEFLQRYSYLTPSLMINNLRQNTQFSYTTGGGWKLIGYVCVSQQGVCNIQIGSGTNVFALTADIICKDYNGTFRNAMSYQGSQTYDNYLGFGSVQTINGFKWLPVYLKSDYSGSATTIICVMKVTGLMPFVYAPTDEYESTVSGSITLPTEKD